MVQYATFYIYDISVFVVLMIKNKALLLLF